LRVSSPRFAPLSLEERLGLVLCRRGRAGFALTADGERIYQGAQKLFASMDAFRYDVGDMHAELSGTLALGLFDKTVTNPAARIPMAIRHFRRQAPDVMLDVTVGTINFIESAVINGSIHVGVVPDHRRSEALTYASLFKEKMYLYCGQRHPLYDMDHSQLKLEDLQEFDYAGLAYHSPNMEATNRFRLQRKATVSDQEAVLSLVLSGCYIGYLPNHYAANFVNQGLIRQIDYPASIYEVQFVAVHKQTSVLSRLVSTFMEALHLSHSIDSAL
jgi:DNA-binding transcriptional LysR family regulator